MADIKKIMETLLGKKEADQVRQSLKEAQDILDAAGVQRKAADGEGDAAGGEAILEAVDSAGASGPAMLVKAILDALAGDALTALEEKLGGHDAVVTTLLKAVSGSPEESGEPPMDSGMMMKSLTDYVAETTKDMGDMARGQLEIAKAVKDVTTQNKDLLVRIAKLEKQLDDRPRQASKAKETEVDDQSEDGKKAKEAVTKSMGDEGVVLGLRVSKKYAEKVKA